MSLDINEELDGKDSRRFSRFSFVAPDRHRLSTEAAVESEDIIQNASDKSITSNLE